MHRYFNEEQLSKLFSLSKEDPKIDALVHLLYDMAARIEDVIGLTH